MTPSGDTRDFAAWIRRVIRRRGLSRLTVFCPPSTDPRRWKQLAAGLRNGRPHGQCVRRHAWGGQVERISLPPDGCRYYLKQFTIRNPRFLHKPPRARRTLINETRLAKAGFSVADTVCMLEERCCGIVTASALVSAENEAPRLSDLFNPTAAGHELPAVEKRRILEAFAAEAGRLHAAGFYHGDMHLSNILCRENGKYPEFVWLDNERGRLFRRLPFRLQVDDLTQVAKQPHRVRRSDLMAAWRIYVAAAGIEPRRADRMLRRVIRRSARYRRRKRLPGRRRALRYNNAYNCDASRPETAKEEE